MDLWRSLVQPIAQSWVKSKLRGLSSSPHAHQTPHMESECFPPALPGFSHPISNSFPLNVLLRRKLISCLLSCKCSPPLLWVCCFACCPNPAHVCPSSPLLATPSLIPQLCKPSRGLHHPSRMSPCPWALPGNAPCTNSFHLGQLMDSVSHSFYI